MIKKLLPQQKILEFILVKIMAIPGIIITVFLI